MNEACTLSGKVRNVAGNEEVRGTVDSTVRKECVCGSAKNVLLFRGKRTGAHRPVCVICII